MRLCKLFIYLTNCYQLQLMALNMLNFFLQQLPNLPNLHVLYLKNSSRLEMDQPG